MASAPPPSDRLTLRRRMGGVGGGLRALWQRRVVRWLAYLAGAGALLLAAAWMVVAHNLPSVDRLRNYQPPLPSNVRGIDGAPIYSFARERRVELSYNEYPPLLVRAFLSAEDKTFFEHHGLDYPGLVRAAWVGITSGNTPRGTSTITQQVAKNLLVGNEASYGRKAREAILAYRIENTLTKQQILELYLNQIFLGRNAYGVEAASHAYFDKELNQLSLAQMAYLAILPKGPANYDPFRHTERAIERRGYVLGEMLKNNFITRAQYDEAMAEPIGAIAHRAPKFEKVGGYFVEEVRRELIDKYGENDKSGPYSVYAGGLWVRSSLDTKLQGYAAEALRNALLRYDRGRGWAGPLAHADIDGDRWQGALIGTNINLDYSDWRAAIAIARDGDAWRIGFIDGSTGRMPRYAATMPVRGKGGEAFAAIQPGDVIAVAPQGSGAGGEFALRALPKISGGMMVQEPATGRILAMQGGFDSTVQSFNRATQAMRQPGSTIKPIVYSAALEHGMTPASIIVDGPFCVYQGARLGQKCFRNFGGGAGSGPHTMRWGIEQSRNLMTVRAAAQTGMPNVVKLIKAMQIGDYAPYLSFALGAGETTVERMVNAYGVLANQGKWHDPTLIDFVQDRNGQVIWPEKWRACAGCNAKDWNGKPMPRPGIAGKQVLDAMTAFQMIHITEGVVQRGTATLLRDLNRPVFGKTGTNTGPTNVWFIGGIPQMVAGVYMGYDTPSNMGGYAQGGTLAAPIFNEFAKKAFEGLPVLPFRAPPGIRMVRIDRASGKQVYGTFPPAMDQDPKAGVIWEAFKPQSEPRRPRRVTPTGVPTAAPTQATRSDATQKRPNDSEFLQRQGGIY